MNVIPGIYEHYKGERYRVIGVGKHSETLEELVIYEALYNNPKSKLWVRPLKLFGDEIIWQGQKTPHFKYIEDYKNFDDKQSSTNQTGVHYTGITTNFTCRNPQGKILFLKRTQNCRDEKGTWELGGGRLEFTESPEQGVLRELEEELGIIRDKADQFLGHANFVRNENGVTTHWIAFSFLFEINDDEPKNCAPKSIETFAWYSLDQLPSPLHQGSKILLEKFGEQLKKS